MIRFSTEQNLTIFVTYRTNLGAFKIQNYKQLIKKLLSIRNCCAYSTDEDNKGQSVYAFLSRSLSDLLVQQSQP